MRPPRVIAQPLLELEWFLRSGESIFFRSTSGSTYERQMNLAYDSAGTDLRRNRPDAWTVMKLKTERQEPSYCPDEKALMRFASVDRWLSQLTPEARGILVAFYGDPGAMWARQFENGRLICLYHLTPTGQKWVAALRARSPVTLPDDARLANEYSAQRTAPDDLRRMRLKRVDAEAKALLHEAHKAFWSVVKEPA
jgi:hypothetical protein